MKQLVSLVFTPLYFSFIQLGLISILASASYAQKERKFIREGNRNYDKEKYAHSEVLYRKAIEKQPNSFKASFNLGDALYKQEKYEDAADQFQILGYTEKDKLELAKVYHNLGNSFLELDSLEESIEAYKNALRNNPKDMETKYNLAYAQQKLKEQQQNQCNKQNQDQEKQDKQKDQQQKQDNQQEQDEQKNQQEKKQQQQEQQENKISKEDAQRLLKALENDEKEVQKRLKKAKAQAHKITIEKDW